jgi:hypothetical protein
MKQVILSVLFFVTVAPDLRANDEKYVEAMQKNIKSIYEARDIDSYQQSVNAFERISSAEKSRWEPLYYIAFGNVMMANISQDKQKKDAYLDRAMEVIVLAKSIRENESEIFALEGFVYMIRVTVDPQTRGMEFAPQAMMTFNRALSINPENPRALALLAQMQFGTAQFFGSPTTEACAINNKALDKFDTFKPESVLAPVWGRQMAQSMKERCQ